MPRRKQTEQNIETTHTDVREFIYCGLRNCPHTECLRHNVNTPWGVIILRKKFSPDKEWDCKDIVKE